MNTVIVWARIALVSWVAALAIVLLAEMRLTRRLVPDWLRTLARVAVLVGAVGAITLAGYLAVDVVRGSFQSRAEGDGPTFELPFKSGVSPLVWLYLSTHQAELSAPAGDDPTPVSFTVEPGETASAVALRLQEQGLVTNSDVFRRYMTYEGLDTSLETGTYSLRANMTMAEIAQELQKGGQTGVTVTIPEGWRAEQVAWLLGQRDLMRADDFIAEVRSGQYDYAWLAGRPAGASLEGFLFPDTYNLATDASPADVVKLMLATFDLRAGSEIESRLAGKTLFDLRLGAERPMTAYDVVILASIVEREAVVPEERPIIASVYFNRLDPAYVEETALRLSSDPTIQYAKGLDSATGNWWNPMKPGEGQQIDSPYNTFKVQGLPPGPICSPGLASILAVLNPAETGYLYFHAVGDGSHVFAETLEEHLANQQKYK